MSTVAGVEEVVRDGNACGESPLWHPTWKRLLWHDYKAQIFALDPQTGRRDVLHRGAMVSALALHRDEEALLVAGENGLQVWRGGGDFRDVAREHDGETLAFNDVLAAPDGRLYADTAYWGATMEKSGKLYLYEPDATAQVLDDGLQMANGLALSVDDQTLYLADSAARLIFAYDVRDDGTLKNKRVWVEVPRDEGLPDGLTVDADGFVWSAQWYGGQVVRYDPDGRVERRVRLPVTQVSSVGFGGPELRDLYITTAGEAWPSALQPPNYTPSAPTGGSLYRLRVDVPGKPEHRCAL